MDLAAKSTFSRFILPSALIALLACESQTKDQKSQPNQPASKPAAEAEKLRASSSTTTKSSAAVPPTKTSTLASACEAGFDEALRVIESQDFKVRTFSCLRAIATACPPLSDAVKRAALSATSQRRGPRSKTLYEAVKNRLPLNCRTDTPEQGTKTMGTQCYKDRHDLSPRLISDMDAGTFGFFLVVEEELKTKGLYGPKARRVLLNLLLTTAMDGEKRKKRAKQKQR